MRHLLLSLFMLIALNFFAQNEKELEVKNTIDTFFDGFHKGDTAIVNSVLADNVLVQTAFKTKEGEDMDLLHTEDIEKLMEVIANRPTNQKWDERLLEYTIKIDGNMANAWTPYEFWFKMIHLAIVALILFSYLKIMVNWKII